MNDNNIEFTPEPDAAWISEWICEQAEPEPLVVDNLGRLLRVTAYQDIPDISVQGSELRVTNLSSEITFDVDYTATFKNDPRGPVDCDVGSAECVSSDCKGADACPDEPNACEGCEGCNSCGCCILVEDVEINPGEGSSGNCTLPGCEEFGPDANCHPSGCDNGKCNQDSHNPRFACSDHDDCAPNEGETVGMCLQGFPDCEWHCTELSHLSVWVKAFTCAGDSETTFSPVETWTGTQIVVPHPRLSDDVTCDNVPTCEPEE